MSKKLKKTLTIGSSVVLLIGAIFIYLVIKDDYQMIEDEVASYYARTPDIAHIEIDGQYALALYERGDGQLQFHAGVMELKKTWFGWEFISATTEDAERNPQYIELTHFSIIQQAFFPGVDSVTVELKNGETYSAPIVKGENTYRRWFYYSDTEDLAGAIVTRYDKNGDKLSEVKVPDEPNEGLSGTVD
ncbi:hypothetical protein HXA34_01785 [Salipaludibacillus agaradhaerens]|uniref:hypothetical protein n=1 Tax=Salipaludibacillus agaradhaerens TaxID=76935 RepID=UPI0021514520|nr:hypothetical protein [Salipaludibacillus agaradhaerens]MCR6105015.1 hypothetical protein [Salipaludibacillus agaradhaerens]MCR6117060.1 hypothetical protein [Salipaludibacillus agaradhaerens]